MTSEVRAFFRRGGRFARTIHWLAGDALWRFRGLTTGILAGGLASLGLMVGAIALAAVYAHALETGESFELAGRVYEARTSGPLLAMAGGAVLALLLGSAWLAWIGRRSEVRLFRQYQEFCTVRTLDLFAGALFPAPVIDDGKFELATVKRLARGDAGYLGRSARLLVAGIVPAFTCVLALVTLLALEPAITLVTLVLVLVSLAFLYRVNMAAADSSHQFEAEFPAVSREMQALLQELRELPESAGGDPRWSAPVESGGMKRYLDARDRRMFAMERGRFVSNAFLAIIMFAVIVLLGMRLIDVGTGWGRLLIYIVALRHGLVNFRSVTQTLTSVNRFHKQIRRYETFVRTAESRTDAPVPDVLRVEIVKPALPGSLDRIEIKPNSVTLIVTPIALTRFTAGAIMAALSEHDGPAALPATGFSKGSRFVLTGPAAPIERNEETVVLVVTDQPRAVESVDHVVVCDGMNPIGAGDAAWLETVRDDIAQRVGGSAKGSTGPNATATETDDDLDEDEEMLG